ncbi:MAG: MBL fold metallo-hydrolase [Bacteroidales bacterium]|nr:MBL fold metallo-hydrolase [Bacteroidales bacterium]
MEIKTFYFNPIRECCYVAWDETKECVIVDPGSYGQREFQRLVDFVTAKELKPVKVLLTHGHFDHILGLSETAAQWPVEVMIHPADRALLPESVKWGRQIGLALTPYEGPVTDLADGDTVRFGETELKVLGTPGHTPGGVCFYSEPDAVVFTGDTLFAGSIGRTDFAYGDYDALVDSIARKLMPLDGDTTVLPGHGPATSIGYERSTNPFLHA